jgi:hypothetical protein
MARKREPRVAWFPCHSSECGGIERETQVPVTSLVTRHGRIRLAISTDTAAIARAGAVPVSISQLLAASSHRTEAQQRRWPTITKNVSAKLKEQSGKVEALHGN